jgi:hypothetical protein
MIATDGTPTIANAGARGPDVNSKRRWLALRRAERAARIRAAFARQKESR